MKSIFAKLVGEDIQQLGSGSRVGDAKIVFRVHQSFTSHVAPDPVGLSPGKPCICGIRNPVSKSGWSIRRITWLVTKKRRFHGGFGHGVQIYDIPFDKHDLITRKFMLVQRVFSRVG